MSRGSWGEKRGIEETHMRVIIGAVQKSRVRPTVKHRRVHRFGEVDGRSEGPRFREI